MAVSRARRRLHSAPAVFAAAFLLLASAGAAIAKPHSGRPSYAAGVTAKTSSSATTLAQLVDTRTWTSHRGKGAGGNTFPGADVPFGMLQWSPDTKPAYNDGGGYNYSDNRLWGYSLTHVSGPGCPAAGDVPMLPLTGPLPSGDPNALTTPLTHTGEVAQAGYYALRSNQPSTITSEFTATPHSAMARFTYPATTQADFLIKLMASQNGDYGDGATIVGNNEVEGYDTSGYFCKQRINAGQPQLYTVYFDIVFDRPFTSSQLITNPGQSNPAAVALTFDTSRSQVIRAKVGISYVSAANARLNWQKENPGWNFDTTRQRAQSTWNGLLGRIRVAGGSQQQTQEFYSVLYKSFLEPNITSDVNGQFEGADLQVHSLPSGQHNQYGMFSGWDTYHSLVQLQTMLDAGAVSDMVRSQLNYYAEDSILQQWGYNNLNNFVMVGDPMDAIIADAYAFGARGFSPHQALADMLAQATTTNPVRPGLALEQQYGYLPEDAKYGCCGAHGYTSALLEYDTADLALAQFAAALGDKNDAAMLTERANNWQNLFDPLTNLLTPRLMNGQFAPAVTPTFSGSFPTDREPFVEGDAYQYLWDVPNDYSALFSLLGGDARVRSMLTSYLSRPNGRGNYALLTNEFDFGEQFAPDYARDPALTQQTVAAMRNTVYRPGPSGLPNNDDLGANSSTFVWEMLGMYPENPGRGTLALASPGFPQATIHLSDGRAIRITAPWASPSTYYVGSLDVNGKPHHRLWLDFAKLKGGASLDWTLSTTPTSWGTGAAASPPSFTAGMRAMVGFASPQALQLAPGASTKVTLGAQNATARPQRVQVTVSAPAGSGLLVKPANTTVDVTPSGRAQITLTVTAGATAPQGSDTVTAVLTTSGSSQTVTLPVTISAQ